MTNLLEIKSYIRDFVEDNLEPAFANKVYWIGERVNVPTYPYCLLSVIAENKDKRTSRQEGHILYGDERERITTRYKTCTITVGVYNAFVSEVYEEVDMDIAKEFTYEQIDYLEGAFEDFPINNLFSVQSVSPIRQLHEVVDGGYMYRYEIDLTIGYNEEVIKEAPIGQGVVVDIENEDKRKIEFIVTVTDTVDVNI